LSSHHHDLLAIVLHHLQVHESCRPQQSDQVRLLQNIPSAKEGIKLCIHRCAHVHAHLDLMMMAVVTASCQETRRARRKYTLILGIYIGILTWLKVQLVLEVHKPVWKD
jgi:hypothetical protein